jgi:WD40 repeat protein/tRNA A-37 threonylcarbamoyl transferase component Bud32
MKSRRGWESMRLPAMSSNVTPDAARSPANARWQEVFASRLQSQPRDLWVEEVRRDQADRWRSGNRPLIDEYLQSCPELCDNDEDLLVLIVGELLLRRQFGENPAMEEYQRRFPQLATQIGVQYQMDQLWSNGQTEARPRLGEASSRLPEHQKRRLGKYELEAPVGFGAFGVVYKAHDCELDRTVAIKVPRAMHLTAKVEVERFVREAKAVAQLRHPGIVSVYDTGQSDETPFLVTEFVEGTTLADWLSSARPAPKQAAELIATVADALHYAHEMGVVHRDVKPANIMLDAAGAPRLMDFGLARRDVGDMTMTVDGQPLGTPAYMSPEQARGEARNVDGRSDVYSLGVVLYQLITGELPFCGPPQLLLHQVLHDEPRAPRIVNHLVPRDLETICLKAMAKDAVRRYATAREMADDLRRFLRDEPIGARPTGAAERVWRWCRRKPALAGLWAIVGILLLAIALGGTAVVSILLAAIALGGSISAALFRRQAQKEKSLRTEADENLYFHRIALAHRDLTANLPLPGRADELLEACPTERRNWEWHYLKRVERTEPIVLRAPGSKEYRGVAFSHDGSQIAAACGDGQIRIWNRRTGELAKLAGHEGYVYSVAFNPADESRLASSGNDGFVRIWDLTSRRESLSRPLIGVKIYAVGMAYCVSFSPDGQLVAAVSEAGTVQVWNAATGNPVHRLEGHEFQASCVAFSRDGRLLATGSWAGPVRLWDLQSGRLLKKFQLPEHRYPIACLSFSPDPLGRYLAAGDFDTRVDVWDTANETIHRQLRGHSGFISGLAFHPHDARRLASAGEDREVRIWDVPSGRAVMHLAGHIDTCSCLAFSPNGRLLASASYDRTIRLWDATTPIAEPRHEYCVFNCESEVRSVAISADGTRVAAAGYWAGVQVWDTVTGRGVQNFPAFTIVVFSLAFSPNGQRVAAAGFDNGAPPCVLKVLDLDTGRTLLEHREPQEIFATAFSPDGQWLAFGLGDGSVKLIHAATGETALVGKHDRSIAYGCVRFRRDGLRLISASLDGTARIWNIARALGDNDAEETGLAAAPVDNLCCCVSSSETEIALWSVAFSPDGRRFVAGDKDGRLTLWDAETGQLLDKRTEASRGAYLSVDYSPGGRWIVSASEDCTVRVYDAGTLELIHRFRGHFGPIHCVAVGDNFAVTGGRDKTVRIWDLRQFARKSQQ